MSTRAYAGYIDHDGSTSQGQSVNTNCLEHIRCPSCGSSNRFRIAVTCWADVFDDGIAEYSDPEWDHNSIIDCPNCGHTATVADFTIASKEI